jgi:hypothetical protein
VSYRSFRRLVTTGSAVKRRRNILLLQSAGATLLTTAVEFPTKALAKSAHSMLARALREAVAGGEITTDQQHNLAVGAWLDEAIATMKARVVKQGETDAATETEVPDLPA